MEDINYTQADLQKLTVNELRKLAAQLNLKRYQTYRKNDFIKAIVNKQQEARIALSEQNNFNTDLSDLKHIETSFSNFIVRYSYKPTELSEVGGIVKYLYPNMLTIKYRWILMPSSPQ